MDPSSPKVSFHLPGVPTCHHRARKPDPAPPLQPTLRPSYLGKVNDCGISEKAYPVLEMKALLLLAAAATGLLLTSCNTFIGLGRDIKQLGSDMRPVNQGGGNHQSNDQYGAPVY